MYTIVVSKDEVYKPTPHVVHHCTPVSTTVHRCTSLYISLHPCTPHKTLTSAIPPLSGPQHAAPSLLLDILQPLCPEFTVSFPLVKMQPMSTLHEGGLPHQYSVMLPPSKPLIIIQSPSIIVGQPNFGLLSYIPPKRRVL